MNQDVSFKQRMKTPNIDKMRQSEKMHKWPLMKNKNVSKLFGEKVLLQQKKVSSGITT